MALRASAPSLRQMRAVWHLVSGTRPAAAPRRLGRPNGGVAAARRPAETAAALEPLRGPAVVPGLSRLAGSLRLRAGQQRRVLSASVAVPAEQATSAEPTEQAAQTMEYKLVTFYAFPKGGFADPHGEVEIHKQFCSARHGPPRASGGGFD